MAQAATYIKFKDGFSLRTFSGNDLTPFESYPFQKSCIIVRDFDSKQYNLWEGSKTDLSGNTWTVHNNTLTIITTTNKTYDITLSQAGTIVVYMNPKKPNLLYFTELYFINGGYAYLNGVNAPTGKPENTTGYSITHFPNQEIRNVNIPAMGIVAYMGKNTYIGGPGAGIGGTGLDIRLFQNSIINKTVSTDPYDKGGSSNSSGGSGTFGGGNTIFGGTSDSIDIPPLPTASASAAGFITLFNPTLGQLNNLANYMWSDLFSLETFKKIFADPMDCILGLSIVPVKPASAGTSTVKIGNVSTDVSMNKTSSQYVAVDCGTIDVKEYWGAYLDYAPYTQCEIYLPYVGTKQISVDDVMNKAVHVVYHVDILSGACNAYVKCGDSVLYTFVGQCSSSIPISGNDWTNVLNGAISVAGKIGLAMATGGATALMSGLGAASSIISSSKPNVERSGAMSSTGGLLGIQKPYLILTRPRQALPENQNKYTGYPSFITMSLSECAGYTEIDSVHLENMSCTDEEAQEIESLLKSGVIF